MGVARHFGMFPPERDGPQTVQKIVCTDCGRVDRNVVTSNAASEETLLGFFRRRGWQIKHNRNLCADCVIKAHAEQRNAKAEKMADSKLSVVSQTPTQNSVLAKKIMSDLLFEHYDTAAQDYRSGWDDARIAKECGLSEQFVSQRRAADYGPASPPRIAVINEAAGMAAKVALSAKDISDIARVLEGKAKVLLDEAERLSSVLREHAKKVA